MTYDDFLNKHRWFDKLDGWFWAVRHRPGQWLRQRKIRREWVPGVFYLDHGETPCVLVSLYDGDMLEGVSLVDGRLIGGCSVTHCGPKKVDLETAMEKAKIMKIRRD